MSYRNQGDLKGDFAPHVPSPDEQGFLVLNDAGSILESGGDLLRRSDLGKVFLNLATTVMKIKTGKEGDSTVPSQLKVQFDSYYYNIVIKTPTRIIVTKHPVIALSV